MTAYGAEGWHDFCVAIMGASAALSGLLFVAVSINIERIIAYPALPARAGQTLMVFAAPLLIATFVLVPGQSAAMLGSELLGLGTVLGGGLAATHRPSARPDQEPRWHWFLARVAISLLTALPVVVAGGTLLIGSGGGLYWMVPAVVMAFVGGLANAWVLLVEILR